MHREKTSMLRVTRESYEVVRLCVYVYCPLVDYEYICELIIKWDIRLLCNAGVFGFAVYLFPHGFSWQTQDHIPAFLSK